MKIVSRPFSFIKTRWTSVIGLLLLLIYFAHFVSPALRGRLNTDDPMNIHYYWSRGGWGLVKGLVLFFSTYYRPMAGAFFFALYEIFGLNPLPYHIVVTALLLVNVTLAYGCAAHLSNSKLVGASTALFITYHANMWQLVYLPAFVFDVLCFTFFFSAMLFYLRTRRTGRQLNKRQIVLFLLLYIGALDSKEMAVSLPVVLLFYEIIWHPPGLSARKVWEWICGAALPSLIAGGLTTVYILSKQMGPEALSKTDAYRPRFSWHQYSWTTVKFVNEIFYHQYESLFGLLVLLPTLPILVLIGWRLRQKPIVWAALFVLITPLPITFIPERGGALLYIPLFGWALIVASTIVALCNLVAEKMATHRIRRTLAQFFLLMLGFVTAWIGTNHLDKNNQPAILVAGALTESVITQLAPRLTLVKPGAKIVFMNSVFEGWDLAFIAELLAHDHSVRAILNTKTPLSVEELAKMDYIFAFEGNHLVVLKSPQP